MKPITWKALLPALLCAAAGTVHADVSFDGDLRLRYESTQREPGEDAQRERYRLRGGASWQPRDRFELAARLATGKGDPASANLDFGESISRDEIRLDRLYASWRAAPGLRLFAGKMKNPLFRPGDTPLAWDNDYNPTGFALAAERERWFARAGAFLADRRDDDPDARLYAVQAARRFEPADSAALTLGAGWSEYTNMAGHPPLYDRPRNNSLVGGGYREDFAIVEVFGELELPLGGRPLLAYAQWSRNTEAAAEDVAWTFGMKYGDSEAAGGASFSWAWRDTEADALVGTLTDSDFAEGMTGSRGHILKSEYGVTSWLAASISLYLATIHVAGVETDVDKLLLDFEFSF